MEVKYYSDDGHEFETKTMCENYEQALEEIKNIDGLPMKEVDGKSWYKISSVAEFYFFDHMDDNSGKKSNRDMYDISQIVSKIKNRFPYWITKDFDEGIMIDKKRIDVIDESVDYLNEQIDKLKKEKEELEKLRKVEVTDDDYEFIMDTDNNIEPEKVVQEASNGQQETESEDKNREKDQPILGTEKYGNSSGKLDLDGLEFDVSDIVALAQDESGLNVKDWNELSQAERNNYIEQQIQQLKQA